MASYLNLRRTSLCWAPQQASKSGDGFTDRSPPGTARCDLNPRGTSLCWTFQQQSKVATVSQIAAPQGRRGVI
eukprot:8256812-Pyramimonas_sp.AAC.1